MLSHQSSVSSETSPSSRRPSKSGTTAAPITQRWAVSWIASDSRLKWARSGHQTLQDERMGRMTLAPSTPHIFSCSSLDRRGPSTLQGHMLLRMWTFLDVEGNVNAKCWKLLKKYLGEISGTVSLWCLADSAWVMRNPPTPLLLWGKGGSYGSEHAENGNLRDKHKAAHGVAASWYGPETFIAPRICRTENHFHGKTNVEKNMVPPNPVDVHQISHFKWQLWR